MALISLIVLGFIGCATPDSNKEAILVVSFGTSYSDTREMTITATENVFKEEFASYDVYRAFTS